ncbi:hypothetical protein PYW08_005763 [Mythimna loreyi]|uniref:Uncharacterized protein n=1 Tax=Mythimna loreyi TaxID=667449 RepID=A0ACC2QK10_9NEOP|nr:hypothetical protein PYW08_005763 [Mythimna loreyi]
MMKFFLAFVLIASVASAAVRPSPIATAEMAELQEIIAAIQSPSTDPATAAALEDMLLDILGLKPVDVGPVIINPVEGISVGPAIIPFPLPDGGEVTAVEEPVAPAPVVVAPAPTPSASSPLVQIIVNVNQAASSPVAVSPVDIVAPEIQPEPVQVVDVAAEPEPSPISPPIAVNPIVVNPEVSEPIPPPISPPIAVHPIGVIPAVMPRH